MATTASEPSPRARAKPQAEASSGTALYVLDEPTTGLHFDDVRKLLEVLQRLAESFSSAGLFFVTASFTEYFRR